MESETLFSEPEEPLGDAEVPQADNRLSKSFFANPKTHSFRKQFYPGINQSQWNDWQWQMRNRITGLSALETIISPTDEEKRALRSSISVLPLSITPYYAGLIDRNDPLHPVRRTVIPVESELLHGPGEQADPLGEENHSPVPGLIHRYPDRVLFMVSNTCATYCRYCTRSRIVGNKRDGRFTLPQWKNAIDYINTNRQIRDVIVSGGDPLMLADNQLEWILSRLKRIAHVEMIRIGTKVPAVLPQRITTALVRMLKRYHPLYMSIHFTHPDELTPESLQACMRLTDAGIPLGSQTVLLKGINDDATTLTALFHGLLKARVKPYYLYQCDPIPGSAHFRTSIETGLQMIRSLRGFTSGYAIPAYVIDAPGGGGKIPLLPNYVLRRESDSLVVKNYKNREFRYPLSADHDSSQTVNLLNVNSRSRKRFVIGLTYDLRSDYLDMGYSEEETAEFDRPETIDAIEHALHDLGFETDRIGNIQRLTRRISIGERWDLVFNIAEGLKGLGREAQVPALLEANSIPYTFSDPMVLSLTLHKGMTKRVVRDMGIPTPDFFIVDEGTDLHAAPLPFPLFAKPIAEGTGKGINKFSKIHEMDELRQVCNSLIKNFKQAVLVERFLPGREFTVGIVGSGSRARSIGTIEVLLNQNAEPDVYSYENKQKYESLVTYRLADDDLAHRASDTALTAWQGLGCLDAGRIDMRVDENGVPNFIEVNPLAGLHPHHSDLCIIGQKVGFPYNRLIETIVRSAMERYRIQQPVASSYRKKRRYAHA